MQLNEITTDVLKSFLRLEDGEEDILEAMLTAAKQYIYSQTGLTEEEALEREDLTIACLMLCGEYYDNRTYTRASTKTVQVNPAIKAIIDQYCRNIL